MCTRCFRTPFQPEHHPKRSWLCYGCCDSQNSSLEGADLLTDISGRSRLNLIKFHHTLTWGKSPVTAALPRSSWAVYAQALVTSVSTSIWAKGRFTSNWIVLVFYEQQTFDQYFPGILNPIYWHMYSGIPFLKARCVFVSFCCAGTKNIVLTKKVNGDVWKFFLLSVHSNKLSIFLNLSFDHISFFNNFKKLLYQVPFKKTITRMDYFGQQIPYFIL